VKLQILFRLEQAAITPLDQLIVDEQDDNSVLPIPKEIGLRASSHAPEVSCESPPDKSGPLGSLKAAMLADVRAPAKNHFPIADRVLEGTAEMADGIVAEG